MNSIQSLYDIYRSHPIVCIDTRKIEEGCMFFALKGQNFDGNAFAQQAIIQGASYAIIDDAQYYNGPRTILVENVLDVLQQLAKYHRQQLHIPVIGLTGSNGKTTTKELIRSVLSQKFRVYATQGNLNNHIGVPLTLLALPSDTEIAIIEMGANHQLEIEKLCDIAQPTIGLITNIGKAHLEGFGGEQGIIKGKGELFAYISKHQGVAMVNRNSDKIQSLLQSCIFNEIIGYGVAIDCDVVGELVPQLDSIAVDWTAPKFGITQRQTAQSQLIGAYNFENILVAIALGCYFKLNPSQINEGVNAYCPQNMRSQTVQTLHNRLILDTYNANPSSMKVALDNLIGMQHPKKVVILGDMFELGDYTLEEHKNVLRQVESLGVSGAFLVGESFAKLESNIPYIYLFANINQLKDYLVKDPIKNALVLVKGSRGMKLEQLLELL